MKDKKPRKRSLLGRFIKFLWVSGLVMIGLVVLAYWSVGAYLEDELPTLTSPAEYAAQIPQLSRVFAADGSVIHEFWVERRTLVDEEAIPAHVYDAAVAAEDGNFYTHEGLDFFGMLRAMYVNARDGRFSQGGSTITQQVVRNVFLSQKKTLRRKLEEVFLARKLERHLTKREILWLYVNQIYFGHGNYGVAEAARHYFGKRVEELTLAESALLMSQVPSPGNYNARTDPAGALRRRNRVLERMLEHGLVTQANFQRASASTISLRPFREPGRIQAPYFVDIIRRRLTKALGEDVLLKGGLRIYTRLDPDLQEAVNEFAEQRPAGLPADAQIAAVFMDPDSRAILALSGGRGFKKHPFNRSFQAKRQVGSTFKPVVYGAGLASGKLMPDSTYRNRLVTYRGSKGPWTPRNWDNVHDGAQMTVTDALAHSSNVIAVQALADVGVSIMVEFAERLGFTSSIPRDLSAALGSLEATPLEVTNAYATIASGGFRGEPVFMTRVEDPSGRVVYSEKPHLQSTVPALVARALRLMLRRAIVAGSGKKAAIPGMFVAGKTGTTSRNVDAWFVGFTHDLVGTIWVGNDKGRRLPSVSGPGTAAPIWRDIVSSARGDGPPSVLSGL